MVSYEDTVFQALRQLQVMYRPESGHQDVEKENSGVMDEKAKKALIGTLENCIR